MNNKIHKIIRVSTIPPFVVTIILILFINNGLINKLIDKIFLILFLGIIPVISYPVNKLFKGNRNSERKLAFIFTISSYTLGALYARLFTNIIEVKFIYYTYFLSALILTIFNVFRIKASGHIASITGFVLMLFLFINKITLIYTIPVYLLVAYSSLKLKRHTILDLFYGTFSIFVGYFISMLII